MAKQMARPPKDISAIIGREADLEKEEGIQPASLDTIISRKLGGALLDKLTEKGARIDPEATVTEPTVKPVAGDQPQPEPLPPEVTGPMLEDVPPPEPQIEKPAPATEDQVRDAMDRRQDAMGGPRTVPSPTPRQETENIIEGPANTRFYDEDSMAATIQSVAGDTDPDYKSRTVQSFYDRAILAGVPKAKLDQIFKGVPMTSKVGDNQLATQMAGLQILHDVSAKRLDELMAQAASGLLTDRGKYELAEAMSQHQLIFDQLKGAKRDIARSMNVFKGARERNLPSLDIRAILDGAGGDDYLRAMAEKYVSTNSRKGKNKILEVGIIRKSYDAVVYMAQSVFLQNIDTHMYNLVANTASMALDIPERALAIPVGAVRKRLAKVLGLEYDPDTFYGQDIYARTTGFYNGLLDGISLAARGAQSGTAKDAPRNPVSSEYFSNTPLRILGAEIARTGDLRNSLPGAILDVMGTIYSMPMRALSASDELVGGVAQRMQLHEEAWRLGARIYDQGVKDGLSEEAALKQAQLHVGTLLNERPHEIDVSMKDFRQSKTLLSDIDRSLPSSGIYTGALKFMNFPLIKPLVLFSKSVTNLGIEGAARLPVLNFLSPRFYSEWRKGGRHRDLAVSRIVLGSSMGLGAFYLSYQGRMTGAGPSGTEDRKALAATGWQEFSIVFGEDELNSATVSRLGDLLGEGSITKGRGSNAGKIYVSFKRLEPATITMLMGAAFADAIKYRQYDPDDTLLQTMADAMAASLAEYSTNMPAMQSVNELMRIMMQQQADGGERLVQMMDAYLRQVGNVAFAGTPIVGLSNSALIAKIERIIDPSASQTAVTQDQVEWAEDVMDIDAQAPGIRAFFEAWNKMMSRVPVMSEGVLPKLDERGRPIGVDKEEWSLPLRMMPTRISVGKRDEVSEILIALNHGISYPRFKISGVDLTAEQQNKYLELQQGPIDGVTMDDAIVNTVNEIIDDAEESGIVPGIGVFQSEIDSVVNQYREIARAKMFGFKGRDEAGITFYSEFGPDDEPVLYPDTAREMAYNETKTYLYGR